MTENRLAGLFNTKPFQWGLRGDPHLWDALQVYFKDTPLPATRDLLQKLIHDAFEELTGQPITAEKDFYVEQFSHGGLSSGYISLHFWRGTAIPFLCAQFDKR